jgi:hypothetical protein
MDVHRWLDYVRADADARGLPELKPLLETLARSTEALRRADAAFRHPVLAETSEPPEDRS